MDAAKLAKGLSAIQQPPAVIVLGSGNDAEKMRECFLSGVLDYITEPASETKLREALDRAVKHIKTDDACSEYRLAVKDFFAELATGEQDAVFIKTLGEFISANEGKVVTIQTAAA